MKILDIDIPVETTVAMPEGTVLVVSSEQPGDVPLVDTKDFQVTSERKDDKIVVTCSCKARVNVEELKKRIEEGRLTVLDLERDG